MEDNLYTRIKGAFMNSKLQRIYTQLFPYLIIGTAIAIVVGLLIMLSCILVWGIIIGSIIWVATLIKKALFSQEKPTPIQEHKHKGRIIEHDNDR